MGYNIIDIIDKAINIAITKKNEYESLGKEKYEIQYIKIVAIALGREADKTIQYYEKLKKEIYDIEPEDIDFDIYDKISFLINEFNKKVYVVPKINNIRDYLKFAIDLEKDILSLLIDIQGRFVKNKSDTNTKTYNVLSDIIKNKAEYVQYLEKILK